MNSQISRKIRIACEFLRQFDEKKKKSNILGEYLKASVSLVLTQFDEKLIELTKKRKEGESKQNGGV